MGEVRVLPSSKATVEVTLRFILEQHRRFRGVLVVTIDHLGHSSIWTSNDVSRSEQHYAGGRLMDDAINGDWAGDPEEVEPCPA